MTFEAVSVDFPFMDKCSGSATAATGLVHTGAGRAYVLVTGCRGLHAETAVPPPRTRVFVGPCEAKTAPFITKESADWIESKKMGAEIRPLRQRGLRWRK